jgi:hypothetical protein
MPFVADETGPDEPLWNVNIGDLVVARPTGHADRDAHLTGPRGSFIVKVSDELEWVWYVGAGCTLDEVISENKNTHRGLVPPNTEAMSALLSAGSGIGTIQKNISRLEPSVFVWVTEIGRARDVSNSIKDTKRFETAQFLVGR